MPRRAADHSVCATLIMNGSCLCAPATRMTTSATLGPTTSIEDPTQPSLSMLVWCELSIHSYRTACSSEAHPCPRIPCLSLLEPTYYNARWTFLYIHLRGHRDISGKNKTKQFCCMLQPPLARTLFHGQRSNVHPPYNVRSCSLIHQPS